jgi:hypothetical protein
MSAVTPLTPGASNDAKSDRARAPGAAVGPTSGEPAAGPKASREARGSVVCLVIPAYNDWESVGMLLGDVACVGAEEGIRYHVIVVDDSSSTVASDDWTGLQGSTIDSLRIVRLACNLGHQRAIAVGLVVANNEFDSCSAVVVMDGDGEDRPADIAHLLASSAQHPGAIICARRGRRTESFAFRASYRVYKILFGGLTGVNIDFGNFCLIPRSALRTIVSQAGIWNHLAATLTRSRVPLVKLSTVRGERYAGKPKMDFVSLVLHGLSAVSVYADVALVRLIILAVVFAGCIVAGIVVIAGIRFLTHSAIPGWASNVTGALLGLLFQAVIAPAIGVFVVLSSRTSRTIVPLKDADDFVESIRTIHCRRVPYEADSYASEA